VPNPISVTHRRSPANDTLAFRHAHGLADSWFRRSAGSGFPEAIAASPGYVGLLIAPAAATLIRGTRLEILGEGAVTVRQAASARQDAKVITHKSGDRLNLQDLRAEAVGRARN
jgi:hypothetical protein